MKFPTTSATVHTLKNGLTVILEADSSAPVISTQVWVKTGSVHEHQFLGAGISHLLEHMVFKGTESFSGDELSLEVQAKGGQWNAYTTFDRTVYYIDGPAESEELFLKVLLEMVFKPAFPVEEFEKEKDVIRREIDMGLDDPDSRASRLLFSTAFANDERCHPVIGHLELFNKITHEDMLAYHQARYTTENSFVSISGDIDKEKTLELLESLCEGVERSFTQPVNPRVEPAQQGLREAVEHFSVPAAKHTMAWQGPSLEHEDAPALDLLMSLLGSGRSSRLYQSLREEKQICLHIGGWSYHTNDVTGLLAISAELEPARIAEYEECLLEELQKLTKEDLAKELNKVKRMTLSSQFRTLSTASGRASDLASNWNEARNLDFTRDYLEKIEAVTEEDIYRVARKWLSNSQTLTKVTILPEEAQSAQESQNEKEAKGREIKEHVLSNGLRLILGKDARIPTVSMKAAVKMGLPALDSETAGAGLMLGTLLTRGAGSRSSAEIAETLDSLGASVSATSGNNTVVVSGSCLSPDLQQVMEIFSECIQSPTFKEESIERERKVQLNAIEEASQDPASLAFKNLRSTLFDGEGYGLSSLGTKESVEGITQALLMELHQKYFNANNMAVSIFGDFDPEVVLELAEQHLASIPTGEEYSFNAQSVAQSSELNITLDKQQAVLAVGFEGASLTDKDRYCLALLNAWCSDMAGPLFGKIREELGLAYYVSSTMFHGFETGFFGFYLGTSPEQIELARKELLGTIERISKEGMTEKELESVKTSWLAKHALSNQSHAAVAGLSVVDVLLGLGAEHFMHTAEEIKALTAKDIRSTAKRFFADQQPTIVTVMP